MYAKKFTSVFTDKKGYGLNQYNIELCPQEDEIWKMSRVRLEESKTNTIFMLSETRMDIFEKI